MEIAGVVFPRSIGIVVSWRALRALRVFVLKTGSYGCRRRPNRGRKTFSLVWSDRTASQCGLGVVGIAGAIAITNMNATEPNTIHWCQNTLAGGHDVGSKECRKQSEGRHQAAVPRQADPEGPLGPARRSEGWLHHEEHARLKSQYERQK